MAINITDAAAQLREIEAGKQAAVGVLARYYFVAQHADRVVFLALQGGYGAKYRCFTDLRDALPLGADKTTMERIAEGDITEVITRAQKIVGERQAQAVFDYTHGPDAAAGKPRALGYMSLRY